MTYLKKKGMLDTIYTFLCKTCVPLSCFTKSRKWYIKCVLCSHIINVCTMSCLNSCLEEIEKKFMCHVCLHYNFMLILSVYSCFMGHQVFIYSGYCLGSCRISQCDLCLKM